MRSFLRDNVAVVIGISLPIVVMIFFMLASRVPRAFVDPPQHDLLLLSQTGYDARTVRVDVAVDNGRLRARMYKADYAGNPAVPFSNTNPRVFVWSHEGQSVREIPLTLPDDVDAIENGDELVIEELAGRRISAAFRAPDGYEFRAGGYDRGFFGLFFDGGASRPMIAKNGATIALSVPTEVPYWNVQFLAWIIE